MMEIKVVGRNPKFVENICEILNLFGYPGTAVHMGEDFKSVNWDFVKLMVFDVSNGYHVTEDINLIKDVCCFGMPVLVLAYPDDLDTYMCRLGMWPNVYYLKKMASVLAFEKKLTQLVGSSTI